jgi:adenylate cyclase
MIKKFRRFLFMLLLIVPGLLLAQKKGQARIDSMIQRLSVLKQDTNRVNAYGRISEEYAGFSETLTKGDANFNAALYYAGLEEELAHKLNYAKGIINGYGSYCYAYKQIKDYSQALVWARKGYDLAKSNTLKYEAGAMLINIFGAMRDDYLSQKKPDHAEAVDLKAVKYMEALHNIGLLNNLYENLYYGYFGKAKGFGYLLKGISLFKDRDTSAAHIQSLTTLAGAYSSQHDLVHALDIMQKAQKLNGARATEDIYNGMANLYEGLNEYGQAIEMRKKVLKLYDHSPLKVLPLYFIGRDYRSIGDYNMAIQYDNRALKETSTVAISLKSEITGELAENYYLKKNYSTAIALLKADTSSRLIVGKIYRDAPDSVLIAAGIKLSGRYPKALQIFLQNLQTSKRSQNLSRQSELYENLYLLYDKMKEFTKAYEAYKNYITLRDSLAKLTNKNEVMRKDMQFSYTQREDSIRFKQLIASNQLKTQLLLTGKEKELKQAQFLQSQASLQAEQNKRRANEQQLIASQKDDEIQKTAIKDKQQQSYYLYTGIAALILLSFFISTNYLNQRKATKQITAEKHRSDDLLLNILPADVAEELKKKGSANARLFDEVTVLFTDFVNFTTISELLSPQELVDELHCCFKAFDGIMAMHHIEKIKTIGDAYLAVAGLPHADTNHAFNSIKAAQDIQRFIHDRKQKMGDKTFGVRIGIHSGSVVAGIVGVKKFAYDIWGDTVNTAARMEQNSQPGRINVSEKTYELVKDQFVFTYRGEIEAKNKGALKMYFVG